MNQHQQVPGKTYTFRNRKTGEIDFGILPSTYGESNGFVWWIKRKELKRGGCWVSRRFRVRKRADWSNTNPDKERTFHTRWYTKNRERSSVAHHHYDIFNSKSSRHKNYEGMPFYDEWNPDKGGTFQAGADWIILNLGKRPDGTSLHIVQHDFGFVPGNLEWTYPRKQANQQMFKIIAQQRSHIKDLEKELMEVKIKLDNVSCLC